MGRVDGPPHKRIKLEVEPDIKCEKESSNIPLSYDGYDSNCKTQGITIIYILYLHFYNKF